MKRISLGALLLALSVTSPAYAGKYDEAPPPHYTPPAPTQVQGQAQGQIQGQGQLQSLKNTVYGPTVSPTIDNRSSGGAASARGGDQTQGQTLDNRGAGANSNNYTQAGNPVATSTAPSFAVGYCQWALSGGAQFFGFGGSLGGAGLYEFCKPLMKAKHFYEHGKPVVAKNLECNYAEFKEAYRMAGEPCRNDMSKAEIASADAQATAALSAPPAPRAVPASASAGRVVCLDINGREVPASTRGASCGLVN